MPPPEPSRVFISYARKVGAALAQRLKYDLENNGFDAWLDTRRIASGAVWTNEIEVALDRAEYVVALLTQGSYVSEICRAEQLRALRKHKCVIPLMAQGGADVPLHLEAKNYRDFTAESSYAEAFKQLLGDLHGRKGIPLKEEFRQTPYVTVPPLPINFVERPEALAALRDALITDDGGRHIALTALQGMGGIGKTVLAQALCHDEVVQQAFPDGIVWITIGKESAFDAVTRMREVGKALGDDLSRYENELAAKNQYRSTIRKKAALIVVDDVCRSGDLGPLLAEDSPRSRLLFTTRDARIAADTGAREHVADLLTEEQSRDVLARWSRTEIANLPPIAAQLIHECGRLPLALSMVGAMLRGKPATYWKTVLEHLRNADLAKIKAQFPDYPYTDVLRAIQVSVDSLDETSRARYLALAVLLEEMAAAPPVQQCLWGVDENQAAETAEQFVSLSLAQRDQPEGSIRLHDLQLDYVRAQYPDRQSRDLIHDALRLSYHVIERDPGQFASQMMGRLLPCVQPEGELPPILAFQRFASSLAQGAPRPWLRPLWPALHPPGTALLRTLGGHYGEVWGVAVTPDGKRAVSASEDKTLKVWNLETGEALKTLEGHSGAVHGVVVTPDGKRAVSASGDKTLKVWNLKTGEAIQTLEGHPGFVHGVAVTPDGKRAISASWDFRLGVWDLETGRAIQTLVGHRFYVHGVTVTPDGKSAVSASWDETLKVWDLETGRAIQTLKGHSGFVFGVAVTPDGKRAVSASGDKTLKVWDLETGHALKTLEGHSDDVYGVAVTPDGKRVVSASRDKTLKVWELEAGHALDTLRAHSGPINAVAVTPDGKRAVSASDDHTLKVWDLETGCALQTLEGHSRNVQDVAVTPDGGRAVSASWDDTLKVWELKTGRALQTLEGHSRNVQGVAVTPDGKRAISASF